MTIGYVPESAGCPCEELFWSTPAKWRRKFDKNPHFICAYVGPLPVANQPVFRFVPSEVLGGEESQSNWDEILKTDKLVRRFDNNGALCVVCNITVPLGRHETGDRLMEWREHRVKDHSQVALQSDADESSQSGALRRSARLRLNNK